MNLFLVIIIIFLALLYDFLNGANDRANAIATTTATKALSPKTALILASAFNLLGAFVSTKVAKTIGKGIVLSQFLDLTVIIFGLLGAIGWTYLCTKTGIPISVTHALIGGMIGAGLVRGGFKAINWHTLNNKVFLAIVLGPLFGFLAGALIFILIEWIIHIFFKKIPTNKLHKLFRKVQVVTTPFMAFTHGMNDTQNGMGIIAIALLLGGFTQEFTIPLWVKLGCGLFMALGTFFMGWRVMKTLGWKMAKIEPHHGASAELAAGLVIGVHSLSGIPLSTTQVVCSSTIGGSLLQNWRRVKQIVAKKMVIAWIVTIPGAALFSALVSFVFLLFR